MTEMVRRDGLGGHDPIRFAAIRERQELCRHLTHVELPHWEQMYKIAVSQLVDIKYGRELLERELKEMEARR